MDIYTKVAGITQESVKDYKHHTLPNHVLSRQEMKTKQIENGRYKIYFPHSCVLYLRGKGRKDTLGMDIIMPDGRVIKYELPAIYIERYTQDVIFQKKLLFFLPFYVMRYEKSREDIEKDPEKLQKLLDEYVTISRRLEESLLE